MKSDETAIREPNKAWPQYLATTSACFAMVCNGNVLGWSSPTMSLLLSDESPIPITYAEFSWITSLLSVFISAAAIFAASTVDKIGRKPLIITSALCYIAGWMCVLFANNRMHLYIYKIFVGFGMGTSIGTVMMYIGETVEPGRRGIIGILSILCLNLGIIFESILGPRLSFRMLNGVSLTFPILFLVTFSFMPESPHFLVSRGKDDKAYSSLMWLRGQSHLKSVEKEFEEIKLFVNLKHKLNFFQTINAIFSRQYRKTLIIVLIAYFAHMFSGSIAITSFTERIFHQIDSTIKPSDAVVILNIVSIISNLSSMFIVDKFGRKILFLASLLGCSLSHILIATYLLLSKNGSIGVESAWMGMVGLFSFKMFLSVGIATVPKILVTEIFPNETKAWSNCLIILYESVMIVIILKLFQIFDESVGLYAAFVIFAVSLIVTFILVIWLVPETKNKSFVEIQELLQGVNFKNNINKIYNT